MLLRECAVMVLAPVTLPLASKLLRVGIPLSAAHRGCLCPGEVGCFDCGRGRGVVGYLCQVAEPLCFVKFIEAQQE